MNQTMGLIVFLGLLGAMLGTIYLFGRWILGPIDRAAKLRRQRVRFSISDFLCLFVVVQLPLTVVSRLQSEDTAIHFWIFTILAWVVAPIIWVACAVSLSRAGITSGKHRFLFMGLILPIVYYGLTPFVVLAAVALGVILLGDARHLVEVWWLMPAWLLAGAALVGCGLYTHWLTQHTGSEQSVSSEDLKPPIQS